MARPASPTTTTPIYITTYTITPEEIAERGEPLVLDCVAAGRQPRATAAKVSAEEGAFEGKTVGVVFQDSPGDPEIVETGLLDTLEELGVEVTRADALGCAGGNNCNQGVIESVQGMIADGVDVIFPLLNVISLPGYIGEMVTQGFQPGQVQFYQVGLQRAVGRPRLEQGAHVRGRGSGGALQRHRDHRGRRYRNVPAARLHAARVRARCATASTRKPAARCTPPTTPRRTPRTARPSGTCSFVRIIARAIDAAGPNPTREDLAAAVEDLGALDGGGEILGSFEPGKYTAPNALNRMTWNYPCPEDMIPFDGICIVPEGGAFPFPE